MINCLIACCTRRCSLLMRGLKAAPLKSRMFNQRARTQRYGMPMRCRLCLYRYSCAGEAVIRSDHFWRNRFEWGMRNVHIIIIIVEGGGDIEKERGGWSKESVFRIQRAKQRVTWAAVYRIHALHGTPCINIDCMVHLHTIDLVVVHVHDMHDDHVLCMYS